MLLWAMQRLRELRRFEVVDLNGEPAVLIYEGDSVTGAIMLHSADDGDVISLIRWIRNPDKLQSLQLSPLPPPA